MRSIDTLHEHLLRRDESHSVGHIFGKLDEIIGGEWFTATVQVAVDSSALTPTVLEKVFKIALGEELYNDVWGI